MEQLEYANLNAQMPKVIDHQLWVFCTAFGFAGCLFALYKPRSIAQKAFGFLSCMWLKQFIADGLVVEHSLRKYCLTQNDFISQEIRTLYQFYDPRNPFMGEINEKSDLYLGSIDFDGQPSK